MRRDPKVFGAAAQRTIRQVHQPPGSKLCGLACIAMLTGYDFATLFAIHFRNRVPGGIRTLEAVDALRFFGVSTGGRVRLSALPWNWRRQRLTRLVKIQDPANKKGDWHWVVYDGARKFFLDPLGIAKQDQLAERATSSLVVYGGPLNLSGRATPPIVAGVK